MLTVCQRPSAHLLVVGVFLMVSIVINSSQNYKYYLTINYYCWLFKRMIIKGQPCYPNIKKYVFAETWELISLDPFLNLNKDPIPPVQNEIKQMCRNYPPTTLVMNCSETGLLVSTLLPLQKCLCMYLCCTIICIFQFFFNTLRCTCSKLYRK